VNNASPWPVYLLVLFCAVLSGEVSHAINITGGMTISGTTTSWKSAVSPVYVSGVISVLSGGTLLIEPGVICIFEDTASGITVRPGGQLLIAGADNNRVVLEARQESWAGITFLDGSKSAVFGIDNEYVSGSIIQNANISRAGYPNSLGLSLSGAAPYLSSVGMFDCGAIKISNFRGSFVANKLSVLFGGSFTGNVIDIRGATMNSGKIILNEVRVQARSYVSLAIDWIQSASVTLSSFDGGVYLNHLETITVEDNVIAPYRPNIAILVRDSFASHANSIRRNHLFSRIHIDSSSVAIRENIIQESVSGGITVADGRVIDIVNNTITKCTSDSSDIVNIQVSTGSLHFENNTIMKNLGQNVISLMIWQAGSFQFANNTILQNDADIILFLVGNAEFYSFSSYVSGNVVSGNIGKQALLQLSYLPSAIVTENLFFNNSAPMSVKVHMPKYDKDLIGLPRNYWGEFYADIIDRRASVGDILTTESSGPIVDFNPVLKDFSTTR
jgi:hypothetical protein